MLGVGRCGNQLGRGWPWRSWWNRAISMS